ncbi:hypothetical protein [Nocardia farcinica]|uniref:hypothetical protein n=1 Tax=Nocardia farcinica TaxID=37329 RepID=UPI001895CF40|nr:hypothetical protein [Nocardia farcinica]MBF6384833.1 hypothetical protein [Nocardia farcinica]MBF6522545.1 hypothetical protein [Nocardia farcinica]MBF6539785.1 hypothetical protein [Nocardia farcinica]
MQEGLTLPTVSDHRRALHSYVTERGLAAQWSQDWSELAVDVPGLTATFSFDRYGRVQRIDGSIGAAP